MAWATATLPLDWRRTLAIGLLLAAGVGLNVTGVVRRIVPLRVWLRVLGGLVVLGVLGAVLAVRWSFEQDLTSVPLTDVRLRADLTRTIHSYFWLALTLLYVLLSLIILPPYAALACVGNTAQEDST